VGGILATAFRGSLIGLVATVCGVLILLLHARNGGQPDHFAGTATAIKDPTKPHRLRLLGWFIIVCGVYATYQGNWVGLVAVGCGVLILVLNKYRPLSA